MKQKLQAPRSKLQRSTKPTSVYPEFDGVASVAAEGEQANGRHPFDLEERTALFGESIVRFSKKIPRGPASDRLIDQLLGCGTSIGANYCEANEGVSKKDFHAIIGRCKKESKETKYFLRLIATAEPLPRPRRPYPLSRSHRTSPDLLRHVPQNHLIEFPRFAMAISYWIFPGAWILELGASLP